MCGIVGMVAEKSKPVHKQLLSRLFFESRIRGRHAFGFSVCEAGKVVTKRFLNVEDCVEALPDSITKLIGHCRYSTSGDYLNQDNNQPIQVNETALAFNGVVSMATKQEYSAEFGREYKTENDGEIILDQFERNEPWPEFLMGGNASFAGLFLTSEELTAFRNSSRPLYYCEEASGLFFASTADIFKRAGFKVQARLLFAGEVKRVA